MPTDVKINGAAVADVASILRGALMLASGQPDYCTADFGSVEVSEAMGAFGIACGQVTESLTRGLDTAKLNAARTQESFEALDQGLASALQSGDAW